MPDLTPNQWPDEYPIPYKKALELVNGPLGQLYRDIALSCCVPLLWFRPSANPPRILHNGTVTVVKTPKKLIGITAAHVLEKYNHDSKMGQVTLQLKNEVIDNLTVIDSSSPRDLATITLEEELVKKLELTPLDWPPHPPVEGKGLLVAGYPGNRKAYGEPMVIDWRPFSALTTARTVTVDQITILIDRHESVTNLLPSNCDLGGISGGPIIGIFETEAHVAFHRFSGVITEHPDYSESDFSIERIIGASAEAITEYGNIR